MKTVTSLLHCLALWLFFLSALGHNTGNRRSRSRDIKNVPEGERCCLRQAGDTPIAKSKRKPVNMAFMLGAQKSGRRSC